RVARAAADAALSGLSFYRGIPGTIGGAIAMNAGAYGGETGDVLVDVEWLDRKGDKHVSAVDELNLSYRHNGQQDFALYTSARFKAVRGDKAKIIAEMEEISDKREDSQPVKSRTGGSTFKNPDGADPEGLKAWKLIDAAGCRGLRVGDAQVSEQHCNFLINHGVATAQDLETLGETVRQRVLDHSGVTLHWEIKRMGEAHA
ncbi:MAG: UDP-N-acetylmuramate dehydrogenase, partial [Rhodobiaceae bacterium]